MKKPTRALVASLCTLAVSGAMLATGSAALAADAPLFRAKLMANHSGKCLDVAVASQLDAAFVQQWQCYDAPDNQTWNFVAVGDSNLADGFLADGYYTVSADHSGKCLEVAGGSTADNATVHQMTCDSRNTSQQWRLVQRPNGYFGLVARHSGKCLEVPNGNLNNGIGVVQQGCAADRPYQEWKLL
ncbi:RICIN domain-containing protein [Nonomuraea sp. 10N515B]|uniref:RICIN domain-containing protein n=1 Tax=Nonomuraea sp. 10N515B TaxID=3457422 RepID=UPI003FCD9827